MTALLEYLDLALALSEWSISLEINLNIEEPLVD